MKLRRGERFVHLTSADRLFKGSELLVFPHSRILFWLWRINSPSGPLSTLVSCWSNSTASPNCSYCTRMSSYRRWGMHTEEPIYSGNTEKKDHFIYNYGQSISTSLSFVSARWCRKKTPMITDVCSGFVSSPETPWTCCRMTPRPLSTYFYRSEKLNSTALYLSHSLSIFETLTAPEAIKQTEMVNKNKCSCSGKKSIAPQCQSYTECLLDVDLAKW